MTDLQIARLYDSGLTVEEIQGQFEEYSLEAIKISLAAHSAKFRRDVKKGDETFDENIVDAAKAAMGRLVFSQDENMVYKASKFVINEAKGRHDEINVKGANAGININVINLELRKAREGIDRKKAKTAPAQEQIQEAINV